MLKVKIEERHILNGWPGNASHCPIALALKEKFPGKDVGVSRHVAYISGIGKFNLDEYAMEFIEDFDEYGACAVYEQEIELTPASRWKRLKEYLFS